MFFAIVTVIALTVMFLLAAVPTAAQAFGQNETIHIHDQSGSLDLAGRSSDTSLMEEAAQADILGNISYSNGAADGKFISFSLSGGSLNSMSIWNGQTYEPVISSINITGWSANEISAAGSVLTASDNGISLYAHDVPNGIVHITSDNASALKVRFASGASGTVVNTHDALGLAVSYATYWSTASPVC